jgi:DNA helicase-2/ATP-dependent DNA helicase PcrA
MDKYRHRLTEKTRTDLILYGKKMLSEFYDQYHSSWSDVIDYKLEHRIQDVHFDGIPVKGFIDRIDHVGNEWHVIDYKTGNADNIGNKLKGPDEKDPKGGHYWRQMVFYDLLLRQDPRIRQGVSKAIVQALEPNKDDKLIERSISITDEDRETLMEQIRDTYSKIQRMEFETGCGECEWCRMHDLTPPLPSEDYEADPR